MTTITLDTLQFAPRLKESGIPEGPAEAVVEAFKQPSGEADLVTRSYLGIRLEQTKFDLVQGMIGLSLAPIALLLGILVKIL